VAGTIQEPVMPWFADAVRQAFRPACSGNFPVARFSGLESQEHPQSGKTVPPAMAMHIFEIRALPRCGWTPE
jgi:hypothetical protein